MGFPFIYGLLCHLRWHLAVSFSIPPVVRLNLSESSESLVQRD